MTNETLLTLQQLPEDKRAMITAYMMANQKDVGTAQALAFFLGGFGVHHMYLKNFGQAVVYVLFFWTFIPAIFAFCEIFMMGGIVARMESKQLQQAKLIYG